MYLSEVPFDVNSVAPRVSADPYLGPSVRRGPRMTVASRVLVRLRAFCTCVMNACSLQFPITLFVHFDTSPFSAVPFSSLYGPMCSRESKSQAKISWCNFRLSHSGEKWNWHPERESTPDCSKITEQQRFPRETRTVGGDAIDTWGIFWMN